ncbi:hypothetical protein FQN57_000927 [Myotisia sp. PD_48]|nr:hypothetical protein FQN57_000927 [Myotisia sp. PD_48]
MSDCQKLSPSPPTSKDDDPKHSTLPLPNILGYTYGADDLHIDVRFNATLFILSLKKDDFYSSPLRAEEFNHALDPTSDCLYEYSASLIGRSILLSLKDLAPPIKHDGKLTAADLNLRRAFNCELHVRDETVVVDSIVPGALEDETFLYMNRACGRDIPPFRFPTFRRSDVEVLYEDSDREFHDILDTYPTKVLVEGSPLLYYKPPISLDEAVDEIQKHNILATSEQEDLHMSRLYGVVREGRDIFALLYYHVESESLSSMINRDTPASLREKWASQIRTTVLKLHQLGVIWGDVKADNVLIDNENNALITDLEGGFTRAWIDEKNQGTVEGDLQGLQKLIEFIFDDDCDIRVRNRADIEAEELYDQELKERANQRCCPGCGTLF